MRDNACYRRQCHLLPSLTVASVEACDAKKSSKARRDHATVGLEAGLALEPIEVAIQLGHQGEREPHVDNGRRCAFRTAYRQLGGACLRTAAAQEGGGLQDETASRSCCVPPYVMSITIIYYKKYFCSINYVQRLPLLGHTWPCFKIFCMVRIYSCLIL